MSIPGLLSWIVGKNSDLFVDDFILSNTTLVIDGWNVAYNIYNDISETDCFFGGNYDVYAQAVFNFFDRLLKSHVRPLVVLSGGWEAKSHMRKSMKKQKKLISLVVQLQDGETTVSSTTKFPPLLQNNVFIEVMKKMDIPFVMCPCRAESTIVTVAKRLDCPVLTQDAEFYAYGIMCIPPDSLSTPPDTNIIKCKIYRIENVQKKYPNFELCNFPLILIVLGDNICGRNLRDFFRYPTRANNFLEHSYRKIEQAFVWLSNYVSFTSAVASILFYIPEEERAQASVYIQETVKAYSSAPPIQVLKHLGLSNKQIGTLQDEQQVEEIPDWLLKEFLAGNFNPFVVNMLNYQIYIPQTQIENIRYNSSHEFSIIIIHYIHQLLMSNENKNIENCWLDIVYRVDDDLGSKKILIKKSLRGVYLKELRESELEKRIHVINSVLEIKENNRLEKLPEAWRLYVATAIFWMKQNAEPKRNKNHFDALLLAMLLSIIDEKFKFWKRKVDDFQNILSDRRIKELVNGTKNNINQTVPAENNINEDDCMKLSFRPKFVNKPVLTSRDLDITVVHVFAQFQSCLKHSMNLNALLGHPYTQPIISELFNGTLLYSLYLQLSKQADVDVYVQNELFGDGIFRVFQQIKEIVVPLLDISSS